MVLYGLKLLEPVLLYPYPTYLMVMLEYLKKHYFEMGITTSAQNTVFG